MTKTTFLTLVMLMVMSIAFSQSATYQFDQGSPSDFPYWIEMMQDEDANFHQTVALFNQYWENREVTRGSGYKPFKRWENLWKDRLNPDGTRMLSDANFKAYFNFLQNNSRNNRYAGGWENLGPIQKPANAGTGQPNGNGRVNAIAFHPSDADIIYVGAPAGGVWKTTDGGQSWSSTTDNLPTLGVSSIVVNYNNPDIVYMGTGDRDAGDAIGMGVMKSTDAGGTWSFVNDGMGNLTVGRLIMHPNSENTLLAATSGGIFKTYDAGTSWTQTKAGNFKEILYKTDDPSIVFASSGGAFYRSANSGNTWVKITSGIGGASRGVVAVTPANPDVVYFLTSGGSEYSGIYRSTDAGLNFTLMSDSPNILSWGCNGGSGGQGWYDLAVAADPLDENIVYAGGVNVFKSTNGGTNWNINSHWYGDCGVPSVHADCHVLEYSNVDGRLYAGNDGGIYWTDNGGTNWTEITSGLAISQIYKIGQSATNKDKVMNGYQDNGSATYLGEDDGFLTVMGGDGMDCAYDHSDDSYAYGEYYNGAGISRIYNNQNQGGIGGGISEDGAWVTPLALDVHDAQTMFVGMKNLWVSHNIRANSVQWSRISYNLGGSNASNINVIEQSEADDNIFYLTRDGGAFFRSDDVQESAPNWTDIGSYLPAGGSPTDIETNPFEADVVYITIDGGVYKSTNRGINWENLTHNLPSTTINTIEYYKHSNEGLYVGTDIGIYYMDADMTEWMLFSDGFPISSSVTELEFYYDEANPANDAVRASTYGRGLWSSPTYYGPLTADFTASEIQIPIGCAINFTDLSSGVPHQWSWTFEGGSPATSDVKNPSNIMYNQEGVFAVTLVVTNPDGSNTKLIESYIEVSGSMLPIVDFTSADTVLCDGGTAYFTDLSLGCPSAWTWAFTPNTVTYLEGTDQHSQHPVVQFNTIANYNVELSVTNSAGTNSLSKFAYIFTGGASLPYSEDFDGASLNALGWGIINPDSRKTWDLTEVIGTNGNSQVAWMNFNNYDELQERDYLISPPLNFSGFNQVFMSFEYAYAQRYALIDSLIVNVSDDCGESWTRVYANGPDGNGIFETSEPTLDFFTPSGAEDWCGMGYGAICPMIDLSDWAGQSNIKIEFEAYNFYGNNLYIDNIEISNTVGIRNSYEQEAKASIYPNPATNSLSILLKDTDQASMKLSGPNGKVIKQLQLQQSLTTIPIQDLAKGVYIIQIFGSQINETKKLIVQ